MTQRRFLQIIGALIVIAAGFAFIVGYDKPSIEIIDQHNYQVAVDGVRTGQSYYAAFNAGFREVYGPIPSVRDVRLPTVYVLLALLPEGTEHIAYAVMAVVSGLVAVAFARLPLSGALVTAYLLVLAVSDSGASQYLYAEFWAVPLAIGAVYSLDRRYDVAALLLSFGTFAVREQGVILLGGVAVYLWIEGRKRWLTVATVALAVLGYFAHVLAVQPYIDPENGVHTPLHLGWEPWDSLFQTLGFGFGLPWIGLLVLVGAYVWAFRHRLLLAVGPYLAIPLLTLVANRPYWGLLTVPISLVLSIDAVWEWVLARTSPTAQVQPDAQ